MKKGVIQFGTVLVGTLLSALAFHYWPPKAAEGGPSAYSAAARFLSDKLQRPRPTRITGPFVEGKTGWKLKATDVWDLWGTVEITNKELRWTATLRGAKIPGQWIIESMAIEGHAVDRTGRISPVADGVNPERGRKAFHTTVQYIRDHLDTSAPATFSPADSSESGWGSVGTALWFVHGVLRFGQQTLDWTATLEDHGEQWKFQDLRVGSRVLFRASQPVKDPPATEAAATSAGTVGR